MHMLTPSSQTRFDEAIAEFRTNTHDSLVCNEVIRLLVESTSDKQYATGSRNECVRRLAADVEKALDTTANLMFRTAGPLHNALQNLMDVYVDMMDEVYMIDDEETACDVCALCRHE